MRPHRGAAAVLAAALFGGSLCAQAYAVTVDWDDLTDAQQEQAYHQLESENQALREQLARLKGEDLQGTSGWSAGQDAGQEELYRSQEGFFYDIRRTEAYDRVYAAGYVP